MSHYRKIDVRIWNDAKFMSLSDDGRMLFMLLMTHPHQTMLGAMRATLGGLSDDLGWPSERLTKAFREVCDKGMAKHDQSARLVWLPNFLKYNQPESPNVVKAWPKAYELLPECPMKSDIWTSAKAFVQGMTEAFRKSFQSLAKEYGESGAGTGAGTGVSTGGALRTPAPPTHDVADESRVGGSADEGLASETEPSSAGTPATLPATAPGDDPTACARAMFETLAITAPAKTVKLAAEAIRMYAAGLCMTPNQAMLLIRRQAQLAQSRGETINAFWFEDSKWKPEPVRVEAPETIAEQAPMGVDLDLGERIWTGMKKAIASAVPQHSFDTWVKPTKPKGVLDGVLYLQIPSSDFEHVPDRYDFAQYLPAGVSEIRILNGTGVAA